MSPRNAGGRHPGGSINRPGGGRADPRGPNHSMHDPGRHAALDGTPSDWKGNPTPRYHRVTTNHKIELTATTTVLSGVIPVVYGERKVYGQCFLLQREMSWIYIGWHICRGELADPGGISEIKINDHDIDDLAWVLSYNVHYGADSQSIDSLIGGRTFQGADPVAETYPGLAYITAVLQMRDSSGMSAEIPNSFDLSCVVSGRKVTDFRDSNEKVSANPILCGYDVETDNRAPWKGNSAATINEDSWTEWANWCDEVIADDSSIRFQYNGILDNRDADMAQGEILSHAHCQIVRYNGELFLVGDKPQKPITGTWSLSGTTATEDSSAGEATTEVSAGDVMLMDTDVFTVASVTDDDTIVFTTGGTVTSEKLRPIKDVILGESEASAVTPARGADVEQLSVPEVVKVNFTNGDTWKPDDHEAHDPSTTPASDASYSSTTFEGCTSDSEAERHGQLIRLTNALQRNTWQSRYRGRAAELFPGDVCRGTFGDGSTQTLVRIQSRQDHEDDTVSLELQEYDPLAYGDFYAVSDTPVVIDPPVPPDEPTSATQYIMELGDWDSLDENPGSDPNDISSWNQAPLGGGTVTYDAGEEATRLQNSTNNDLGIELTATRMVDSTYGMLKFVIRWNDDKPNDEAYVKVQYASVEMSATVRNEWFVTPPDDGKENYVTCCIRFPLYGSRPMGDEIRIVTANGGSGTVDIFVKGARFVRGGDGVNDPMRSLGYRYLWTWVEDGDASETVDRYALVNYQQQLSHVPQGATSLDHDWFPANIVQVPGDGLEMMVGLDPGVGNPGFRLPGYARMIAIGHDGQRSEFPDETQEFTEPFVLPPEQPTNVEMVWRRNVDRNKDDSQQADNWAVSATYSPTVSTDTENSPDGTATADEITPHATQACYIQNEELTDLDWVQDPTQDDYWQSVWLKSGSGSDFDLGMFAQIVGYHKAARIRTHWRLFHFPGTSLASQYSGPGLSWLAGESANVVVAGGSFGWPGPDYDSDFRQSTKMTWTPAADANTLDGYQLQYRGSRRSGATDTFTDWITHGTVGKLARSMVWGNTADSLMSSLPQVFDVGGTDYWLYDWRVVAVRENEVTELIPSSVSELAVTFGSKISHADDVDTSGAADNEFLVYDSTTEKWENVAAGSLGLEDDDIDLSGSHTGLLSTATTVADAMVILDDIPEDGIVFDNDVGIEGEGSAAGAAPSSTTEDFESYSTGSTPSGWTDEYSGSSMHVETESGNKVLRQDTAQSSGLSWDAVGSVTGDILVEGWMRCHRNMSSGPAICMNRNAVPSNEGYKLDISGVDNGTQGVRLRRMNGDGTSTNLAQDSATKSSSGDIYYFKLEKTGTTIRAKYWLSTDAEPGSWNMSVTDSTWTGGKVALMIYTYVAGSVWFDDVTATVPAIGASGEFNIAKVNSSDEVEIGDASLDLVFEGTDISGIEDDHIDLSGTHTGLLSEPLTVADAMVILDDIPEDGIVFDNDVYAIKARNAADTADIDLLKLNASDYLIVGTSSYPTQLIGSGYTLIQGGSGVVVDGGELILDDNDEAFQGRETGGTARNLAKVNSTNGIEIGDSNNAMHLAANGNINAGSNSIVFDNAVNAILVDDSVGASKTVLYSTAADQLVIGHGDLSAYFRASGSLNMTQCSGIILGSINSVSAEVAGGGSTRNLLYLDGSDDVVLGNASSELILTADGTIDAGANDIETTGDILSDGGMVTADESSIGVSRYFESSPDFRSGTVEELLRFYISAPGGSGIKLHYEVEVTDGTEAQHEHGEVYASGVRNSGGTLTGSTATKAWSQQVLTSGTLTVAFNANTAGTTHVRLRITITTSLSTPVITGWFRVTGGSDQTLTWSI